MKERLITTISFLVFFLALHQTYLFPIDSVMLNDSQEEYPLGLYIEHLEDRENRLTFEDILKPEISEKFIKSSSKGLVYGFTDSSIWIRFRVKNNSTSIQNWLIHLDSSSSFDSIMLFQQSDNGTFDIKTYGRQLPFKQRDLKYRDFIFELNISSGTEKTIYMQIESVESLAISGTIYSSSAFIKRDHEEQIIFGFYYGIMAVMVIYNLFIFLFLFDKNYLYYISFIIGWMVLQMNLDGLAYEYLWPNSVWWNNRAMPIITGFVNLSGLRFGSSFLLTKKITPRLHVFILVLMYLSIIQILGFLFIINPTLRKLSLFMTVPIVTTGILSVVLAYLKGYQPARYLLIGWMSFFSGTLIHVLSHSSVLPRTFLTIHGMRIGSVLIVVLFSIALADRYRLMKIEKEGIEQLNIAKTSFFINLSHEIKTPLTLISNYLDEYINKVGISKQLAIIKQNIDKLLENMVNFFDILRFERGIDIYSHDQTIDLSNVLHKKLTLFKTTTEKKQITVDADIEENIYIKADPSALDRIINNLMDNAIRYNKQKGSIHVDLTSDTMHIQLIISDTGIGIEHDQLENIFLPYYQISKKKQNIQGIGMGLSVVNNIVNSMNGRITVDSIPDKGTTFKITLNKYSLGEGEVISKKVGLSTLSSTSPVSEDLITDDKIKGHSHSVLIVEDNRDLLYLLRERVSTHYNVYCALNGSEALIKLDTISPPDVIVSDIMMDDMDGYELLDQLSRKEKYREIPFIFITARTTMDDKLKGLKKGAIDFIFKPFIVDELIHKIDSIIRYQQLQRENYEKDKFASLGMLMGGIAHEIFNPLSGISGPLVNLKKIIMSPDLERKEKAEKHFKYIDQSIKKIERTINVMRVLYSGKGLTKDLLDVTSIINQVTTDYQEYQEKEASKVKFTVKIDKSLEIIGNRYALYRVLSNLVSNSVDAVDDQGSISIIVEKENNEKVIKVIDTGKGIAREDMDKLFDPFYTTKSTQTGTGLGLYIVKDLILKMGWDIKASSSKGEGTTFTIIVK